MMNKRITYMLFIIGSLVLLGVGNDALGKEKIFPTKAIELICPMGPGGSTSIGGRIIAGTLSEFLGVPVVVIYKPGGGGSVAPLYVARSKPDGYTLLIATATSHVVIPAIRSIGYRMADFEQLALYATEMMALVVKSDAPWKTLQELVADAKKRPGELKFPLPGIG